MSGAVTPLPPGPLVAWYGDDFTGSAAVMEVLSFAGLPAVLFFEAPNAEQLARFGDLRGIGIAGEARAKRPDWMAEHLPPAFAALRATGAPIAHYKVCSTFDSAPNIGSIGKAADLAMGPDEWAPLLIAAPAIGRFQAFGTLFAAAEGAVWRLDRHPTMARHPVTPMHEADVRRHLEEQTRRRVGLVDLRDLAAGRAEETLTEELEAGRTIIAIDVVDDATLTAAGRLIWDAATRAPLFAIGSQGIEYALVAAWRAAGIAPDVPTPSAPGPVDRVAAVSGSCSPVTAAQIACAEVAGFTPIPVDPTAALDPAYWTRERGRAVELALMALGEGRDPIVCTARGPDDLQIAAFRSAVQQADADVEAAQAALGEGLGLVLNEVVRTAKLTRAAIAGGDTSSHAARGLGLEAVTAAAPLAPGAALLCGHGRDPATDGLEIALKGGQMGPPDFFQRLKAGGPEA